MAVQVLTDCGLWLAGYNLRGQMNALGLDYGASVLDATTFGNDTEIAAGGVKAVGFAHSGFYDAAAIDKPVFDRIGVSDELMTIVPDYDQAAVTAYMMQVVSANQSVGGEHGGLMTINVSGQASDSDLIRGTLMINASAASTSGNSTARQLGAVTSSQKLYAGLHVVAASGTSPTLDVTIESDTANSFAGAETTRMTFSQATAIGSQWATPVSGAITDTWWRVAYAIGGTGPSFDFVVTIGIQ